MAGRSRFRHGNIQTTSAAEGVAIKASILHPVELETLAGRLESQLAALEALVPIRYKRKRIGGDSLNVTFGREKDGDVSWWYWIKTTILRLPLGKRKPRVSRHAGHLTVSWRGNPDYHIRAWHNDYSGSALVEYEVKVFFKGTVEAPADWSTVYADFSNSGGATAQSAWNDITSNSFIVICRNSATPATRGRPPRQRVVTEPGLVEGHHPQLEASLMNPEQWKWFAFPGFADQLKFKGVETLRGQMTHMIPGGPPHPAASTTAPVPSGTNMFVDAYDCALAIETKIFPNGGEIKKTDYLGWIWRKVKQLLVILMVLIFFGGVGYTTYLTYKLVEPYIEPIIQIFKGEVVTIEPEVLNDKNKRIEKAEGKVKEVEAKNATLKSENEHLRSLPQGLGEKPCWYDTTTGLEFLLEIHISDDGLEIKQAPWKLPLRSEWKAQYESLPFDKSLIGQTITAEQFRQKFRTTYEATVASECRHFVIVDEGDHAETNRYKHDRDIIESYFYIKRPQFGSF